MKKKNNKINFRRKNNIRKKQKRTFERTNGIRIKQNDRNNRQIAEKGQT